MRITPWMTDDAVVFLQNFFKQRYAKSGQKPSVLEFGTGASTLFFATRASEVIGFEHDQDWYERTVAHCRIEDYQHVSLHRFDRPYSDRLIGVVGEKRFDVISIDGRDRVECLTQVLKNRSLAKNGILVIDNSERLAGRYGPMLDLLERDYRYIHLEQLGSDSTGWDAPHKRWMTTIAWRKKGVQFTSKGLAFSVRKATRLMADPVQEIVEQ